MLSLQFDLDTASIECGAHVCPLESGQISVMVSANRVGGSDSRLYTLRKLILRVQMPSVKKYKAAHSREAHRWGTHVSECSPVENPVESKHQSLDMRGNTFRQL